MKPDTLLLNGINGSDGSYLFPEMTIEEAAGYVQLGEKERSQAQQLVMKAEESKGDKLGFRYGVDPSDLTQVGWGIVVAGRDEHDDAECVYPVPEPDGPLVDEHRTQGLCLALRDHFTLSSRHLRILKKVERGRVGPRWPGVYRAQVPASSQRP